MQSLTVLSFMMRILSEKNANLPRFDVAFHDVNFFLGKYTF